MAKDIVFMDGAMGTCLWDKAQERGLKKVPVWRYGIEAPELVREAHEEYVEAGSCMILTDTFAANALEVSHFSSYAVGQVVGAAVRVAKEAAAGRAKVALDIGPLSELLEPYGDISVDQARGLYEEQIGSGMAEGPDAICLETFTDVEMLKIALEVAEGYDVPILCSMSFMDTKQTGIGRTMMGNSVEDIVAALDGRRVEAVGLNCSLGPEDALPILKEFAAATDLPLFFKPNAGLPTLEKDGTSRAALDIEAFVDSVLPAVEIGATYIGGCCGSSPDYIRRLVEKVGEARRA